VHRLRVSYALDRTNLIWKNASVGLIATVTLVASTTCASASCAEHSRLTNQQMYAYLAKGIEQAQAHKLDLAEQTWRTAYRVLEAGCYAAPESAHELVASIEHGNVHHAFAGFSTDQLMPMYKDIGADKPYAQGIAAAQAGNFPAAVSALQTAIRISDKAYSKMTFPRADFALGMALIAEGKRDAAVTQWRLVLSDMWPAVPEADFAGPDALWLAALELYAKQRTSPFN